MANNVEIDVKINPTLDEAKISAMREKINASLAGEVIITPDLQVSAINAQIDALNAKLQSAAKIGADTTDIQAKIDTLNAEKITIQTSLTADTSGVKTEFANAGKESGNTFTSSFSSALNGLQEKFGSLMAPILSVFGGNLLTKGVEGIVGSIGDVFTAGKKGIQATEDLGVAFAQAGMSGEQLSKSISDTSSFAKELANQYALSVSQVRAYSQAAASLTGATGQQNKDLTSLAIAVNKASNGMVDGNMAIRLFGKGISDPESQFAMTRLTKQFPALGTAMKGIKDPAEATKAALEFFAPTFDKMSEQANGPIGSMERLQNSLLAIKTSLGKVLIDALSPFITAFSNTIIPIVQSVSSGISSLMGVLSPLQPIFTAVGIAAAVMATSLLALSGISFLSGLATQAVQFGLSMLQVVVPSLVATGEAEGALILNKEALNLATLKNIASNVWNAAVSGATAAAQWVLNAAIWAGVVAQDSLNASFAISPLGWVAIAIGLIVAACVLLYKNVEIVQIFFDKAWEGIKAGALAVWEIVKGLAVGLWDIFTGDIGGAIDAFSNMGGNASKAFNDSFQAGIEKVDFDTAQKHLDEAFKDGAEINVKVKEQDNFKGLISQYQDAQSQIADLSAKQASGLISDADLEKLNELKISAGETANQIAAIDPAARSGFESVTDGAGKTTEVLQINIDKANEFATSMNMSTLTAQQDKYSQAIEVQAQVIDNEIDRHKALKIAIDATNDTKKKQELIDEYQKEGKEIDANTQKLTDAAIKGAEAGLMTEAAYTKVGIAIGKTGDEVKNLALNDEMKKVAQTGTESNAIIEQMAVKYGKSTTEVKSILQAQKDQIEAQKHLNDAVLGMSDALDAVNKHFADSFTKSKNDVLWIQTTKAMFAKGADAYKDWYNKLTDTEKKAADQALTFTDAEVKSKLDAAKSDKKTKEDTANLAKSIADKEGLSDEKKTKTTKENTKNILEGFDALVKQTDEQIKQNKLDTEKQNLLDGISDSKESNLRLEQDSYKAVLKEKEALQELAKSYGAKITATGELDLSAFKVKGLDATKTQEVKDKIKTAMAKVNTDLSQGDVSILKLTMEIDKAKKAQSITDIKNALEIAKTQIDANIKLGLSYDYESSAIAYKLALINTRNLQDEINKIESSEDKSNLSAKLKEKATADAALLDAEKKYNDDVKKYDLAQIKDAALNEKETKLAAAQATYTAEINAAQGSASAIEAAQIKRNKALSDIDAEYFDKTATDWQKLTNVLATQFTKAFEDLTIVFPKTDTNAINSQYKTDLADIKKSLADGTISYADYTSKLKDLNEKRNDALKNANGDWKVIMNVMNDAIAKSLSETAKIYKSKNSKLIESVTDGSKTFKDIQSELYSNLEITMATSLGSMLAQGKNFWKSMAISAIEAAQTMIPIWGLKLFGEASATPQNVASLGTWATIEYLAFLATAEGLLAVAKSGLSRATGGHVPGGEQFVRMNELGEEFVINHRLTARAGKELEIMNAQNLTPQEYVNKYVPANAQSVNYDVFVQSHRELTSKIDTLNTTVKGLGTSIKRNTVIDMQVNTDDAKLHSFVINKNKRDLAKW